MSSDAPISRSMPILRIARPIQSLSSILHFYCDGLGLKLIASFDNHAGFDGRILAFPAPGPAPWHLEFTYQHGSELEESVRAPTQDNLLVLYVPDEKEWEERRKRMLSCGYVAVKAVNPYWDACGVTFADPEGWRIVLAKMGWEK